MKGRGKKQPVKADVIAAGLQQRLQNGEPLSANMLAVSRAGHDKDVLYVVLAQEGSYLKAQEPCIAEKEETDACTADHAFAGITSGADA